MLGTRSIRAAKPLLAWLLHGQSVGALTGRVAFPSHGVRSRNRVSNPSRFDRNVSCNVYAMADGDTDKTVVDSTSGPLPGLTENEYYYGDNVVHTFRGAFSSVFKLTAPGRVWMECTGGDDGQEPWDGVEAKHRPDDSWLVSRLIATRMSGQLPDWLTGA